MKRGIITALLMLLCFILQSTLFTVIDFAGIVPNLLIILTASYGFMQGEKSGAMIGFFCGLLTDIFFGSFIGMYALIYTYIGYCNGKFSNIFYPEDIKLPIALIIGSDLTYGFSCYLIMFLLRGRFNIGFYFLHVILPEMVYTIVITLFLYPLILWINNRLQKDEKRSEKKFV